MPKSLLKKNYDEILAFTDFKPEDIVIIDGTPKERLKQMQSKEGKVFLMGFRRFSDDWANLKKYHPELDAVAVDEIHMGFKSHNSVRTKQLFKCMKETTHFVAMSGTLIDGRLDSCYPTIHIIEPRYYVNHNAFMAQHAFTDEYGTVLAWHNHAKLGFIFKKHCIRRSFEEIYGAEKKVVHHELCEMHPRQREAYNEFEAEAILELKDEFLDGGNPAVAAMRCRQIMAHPHKFKILEPDEITGKDERLTIHLENHANNKQPLIIYASLVPEQERIFNLVQKYGLSVGLINGTVASNKRPKIDEDFRAGKLQVLVGSPATAAVGYNWGHVDHIIFASLNYQNVDFVQAYRRAIRGVRQKPLWISILEYADSIDQRIFEIINKKSKDLHKVDDSYEKLDLGTREEDWQEEEEEDYVG